MDAKPTVLFVDDEKNILTVLRSLFRAQYQVRIADTGAAALEILRSEPVHVIVSDQRMPNMLGHELLREVKKISPSTMRLLLTGYSDLGAVMNSINDGEIFRFIHKPWDNNDLRTTVASAVKIATDTAEAATILGEEAPEAEVAMAQEAGILVIEAKAATFHTVQGMYGATHKIHHASNLDKALVCLEREEIGVLITDIEVGGEDMTEFLKLLKQQYPLIMTIVLTDVMDSSVIVGLINQAQVYRCLSTAVSDVLLKRNIQHGLRFYQQNKSNPALLQRQQVEAVAVVHHPTLAQRLAGRFKALRSFFRWS